ncbi:hypothetical protein BS50DRAFT_296941 [Corynespora cassiicola Philippines]|uniref:C2H2-type domain-containing protein n=1 Tax=Corynespora cassiicola Philippines TaxID=1448308 RepID=A0A2T2NWN4_CORCC|nr:hypothetical protein BS50DRAFT_296941 [Corynespora cassiicola Philippines]
MGSSCPQCHKIFNRKGALKSHLGRASSTSVKWHNCKVCGQHFCSSDALEKHQSSGVHKGAFRCTVCSATFDSPIRLAQHIKAKPDHKNHRSVPNQPLPSTSKAPENQEPKLPANTAETNTDNPQDQKKTNAFNYDDYDLDDYDQDYDFSCEEDEDDEGYTASKHLHDPFSEDQDWSLCDKDCGWCGHCYQNHYIDWD